MSEEECSARSSPDKPAGGAAPAGGGTGTVLPLELQSLETALATLRPAAPRLDRDRVMFAAGQASATLRSPCRWRGVWCHVAPLAAAAAAIAIVTLWLWRPEPRIVERIVYLPAPQVPTKVADASRPSSLTVVPESLDGGPTPVAPNVLDRPPTLPRWLTALLGIQPDAKSGFPARRMVGGQHFESFSVRSESPRAAGTASPDDANSPSAASSRTAAEPTMSRQCLDRLLNDLTDALLHGPFLPNTEHRTPHAQRSPLV